MDTSRGARTGHNEVVKARVILVTTAAMISALLGACSGGDEQSEEDSSDGTTSSTPSSSSPDDSTTTPPPPPIEDVYTWRPPDGDLSPNDELERGVHNALRIGCDRAQQQLDRLWEGFQSPRSVLLFQAAIELCRGDVEAARDLFGQASAFSWEGLATAVPECVIYQRVVSVLSQVPHESVTCLGGSGPTWPSSDEDVPRDDPRTPELDESVTTTTSASTSTTTSTTTSTSTADG